jgi:Uma2 family endonuclease
MNAEREVIEKPLSTEELAVRYRAMCEDPNLTNLPGKVELDVWGRMVMSPPSYYHGLVQGRLGARLAGLPGGELLGEVPIATAAGLFLPDLAWASHAFIARHPREKTPLTRAPELCIEVVSPSNSVKELEEKMTAYFGVGADEVWIVYLRSKTCQFYGKEGLLEHSQFSIELEGLFD